MPRLSNVPRSYVDSEPQSVDTECLFSSEVQEPSNGVSLCEKGSGLLLESEEERRTDTK